MIPQILCRSGYPLVTDRKDYISRVYMVLVGRSVRRCRGAGHADEKRLNSFPRNDRSTRKSLAWCNTSYSHLFLEQLYSQP